MAGGIQVDGTPFVNHTASETPTHHWHNNLNLSGPHWQPPVPHNPPTGVLGLPMEIGTTTHNSEERYHPGFEFPPLNLDLFNTALENKLVAEPTAEELAAYCFLKFSLGK